MFSGKLVRMCLATRLRHACVQLSARDSTIASECINSEREKNESGEGPSRLSNRPEDKDRQELLRETRKRIKKWKARSANLKEAGDEASESAPSDDGLRRITEAEFVKKVEEEEREWTERTDELMSNLRFASVEERSAVVPPPAKWIEMTPEELELKRKTGKTKFRSIIYNEGELDGTDLSLPPSESNPHPFDPSRHAPPVYSRSIVPFVNYSPLLQALVDIGVNLFEIEQTTRAAKHLLRLDMQTEVKPKLQWIVSLGFDVNDLGDYITRNPFFLLQDLDDMQARVNYLTSMKFTNEDVCKIVKDFRYWLNVDVKTMDSRLGWIQQQFRLSGDQVRDLIRKEARILMFGLGPLQRLVALFNKEFGFTPKELKKMLLLDPRLFMMDSKYVIANYGYVHRTMRLSNSIIARHPFILRCSHSSIRNRHEFLKKLGRANYEGAIVDEKTEEESSKTGTSNTDDCKPVPIDVFLDPSDEVFTRKAANTYLVVYNNFLRNH